MIWSKLDFEREVRRQLIELESIRKRVPADSEVRHRIDRLEASHMNLLRKLEEVFPGPKGAPPHLVGPGRVSFERHLRTVLKTSETQQIAQAIRQRIALQAAPRPQQVEEPASGKEIPSLDTCCASCGRVLLSSLLAGEELVFSGDSWHHADCAGEGESFTKPGMLN